MDDRPIYKGMYCGIPFRFREDPAENGIEGVGLGAMVLTLLFELGLPFNGEVIQYESPYIVALWRWLEDGPYDEED